MISKIRLYNTIILEIIKRHYTPEIEYFEFNRSEIKEVATFCQF